MDRRETLAIFLDTNVVLHFRRVDEIDWCGLTDTAKCDLVATPLLFRELERQKALNPSPKLRRRAAASIDYFADLLERSSPICIRADVRLAMMEDEPLIDFAANRLTWEVGDDQLIASALDYSARTGCPVAIATGDRGFALKMRSRPIRPVRLPDQLRLRPAAEADAVEIRRLKRELAELKDRRPRLALTFGDGTTRLLTARPVRPVDKIAALDEIKARYRPQSLPTTRGHDRYAELLEPTGPANDYGRYLAEQYNGELERFLKSYAEYLSAYETWRESVGLILEFDFLLQNQGRGPTTNIDVHIAFPETFGLFDINSRPQRPAPPTPPDPTGNRIFHPPPLQLGPVFAIGPKPHRDGLPRFERNGHRLVYDAGTLKHACTLRCEPVAVRARAESDLRPFQLPVSITCNETEKVEDVLSVGFE